MPEVHLIVATSESANPATAKKRGRPKKVIHHGPHRDRVMVN